METSAKILLILPQSLEVIKISQRINYKKTSCKLCALRGLKIIRVFVAKKDIVYSNSSIEAINDYNNIRPNGSLKGQTPSEAYQLTPPDDIKAQMALAKTERMKQNKAFNCSACSNEG